jgi:hypothetical protein
MVGVIGASVGSQVNGYIADGMSIGDAVAATAMDMGIPQSEANAMGVNAAKASVESAIATNTDLATLNPADVAAYKDSLGALIDMLGITDLGQQVSNVSGQVGQLASDIASQNTAVQNQINDLASSYQQVGMSQQDALNLATSEIQGQLSDQAQQIADLTALYESIGLNTVDATNQAIADTAPSQNVGDVYGPDNIDVGGGWSPASPTAAEQAAADAAMAQAAADALAASQALNYGNVSYTGGNATTESMGSTVTDSSGNAVTDSSGNAVTAPGPSSDSGGGGGGSSKIVCTAMNHAYGFGSFRNQIWLKYSADNLTKAHEVGYHTLFLPLVDIGYKKNIKPVRVVLEHIARHRTADLRAEMRGKKRDNIGRAYRAILEPVCYIVGKLKGY